MGDDTAGTAVAVAEVVEAAEVDGAAAGAGSRAGLSLSSRTGELAGVGCRERACSSSSMIAGWLGTASGGLPDARLRALAADAGADTSCSVEDPELEIVLTLLIDAESTGADDGPAWLCPCPCPCPIPSPRPSDCRCSISSLHSPSALASKLPLLAMAITGLAPLGGLMLPLAPRPPNRAARPRPTTVTCSGCCCC